MLSPYFLPFSGDISSPATRILSSPTIQESIYPEEDSPIRKEVVRHSNKYMAPFVENNAPLVRHILSNVGLPCLLLEGNQASINSLTGSAQQINLITYLEDKSVKLWNPQTGECLATFRNKPVNEYTLDGEGNMVKFPETSGPERNLSTPSAQKSSVHEKPLNAQTEIEESYGYICFSKSGNRSIGCTKDKKHIRIWQSETHDTILELPVGDEKKMFPPTILKDGIKYAEVDQQGSKVLIFSHAGDITCIDLVQRRIIVNLMGGTFTLAKMNSRGNALLLAKDRFIRLYTLNIIRYLFTIVHPNHVTFARFNADDTAIVSSDGNNSQVWDATSGAVLSELTENYFGQDTTGVKEVEFNHSGTLVATTLVNGTTKVIHGETGIVLCTLPPSQGVVDKALFDPEGNYLITLTNGVVHTWNIRCHVSLMNAFSRGNAFTLPQTLILVAIQQKLQNPPRSLIKRMRQNGQIVVDFTTVDGLQTAYEELLSTSIKKGLCQEADRDELFKILNPFVKKIS